MNSRFQWHLRPSEGVTIAALRGPVNEDADFSELVAHLRSAKHIRLELSGVEQINSCGVREWVNFVRALPQASTLELEKCPPSVVSQLNIIRNFAGSAQVLSVYAPYLCDACGHELDVLVDVRDGEPPVLEEQTCEQCGARMEFDDLEDSYFAFLSA